MKGVAERSSVFASEIFTAIPPIPAPYNNSDKQNASNDSFQDFMREVHKNLGFIEWSTISVSYFPKFKIPHQFKVSMCEG